MTPPSTAAEVETAAREVVGRHDPGTVPRAELFGALYDAGLAWVHHPVGLGGLGLSRGLQTVVDGVVTDAGGDRMFAVNPIGYGMGAPTVVEYCADRELVARWLRPLATGEEIWCQLFSEPGAGSDVAGLTTSAVPDGDGWVINGQKVWTTLAHVARWGMLVARTDPDLPKHRGLTYFVIDMTQPGVEVRPLRQMTGQAEFNEVYLHDARVLDAHRLGDVGAGWRVAITTLMNERTAIGGVTGRRSSGVIGEALGLWRANPDRQTAVLRDRLARLWTRAETHRLTLVRAGRTATEGRPGPEGSVSKLVGAELNQDVYEFCMDLLGPDALLYDDYEIRPDPGSTLQQRFLRSRANTIEGGTSEVMRNILGERVLGLPGEPRSDSDRPWKEVPRG
ncbi:MULTISPECIES: acyl-CoA dehydrogenase family protein [Pseudonocardia]|uniref:Acyl-CoA dehydrogenase n=2 Tax=Pseudonocardia TaxID=1847 RepID=A0A1Y2N5X5_PSEAH|nr:MULTISPECIES: acyl-CoA dehydrogenase family protein [Pseudonocardia]OSY42874.1 Acyl-CoA dehydrogenase [Pseudonocardia autotrophica]TDN77452.1 alkylation response protein AidB-like acyl-CoA dehydrogenase [Pseudonocardia autotrophica]BBG01474.1 acyl-CoA dehydrogenase [Pseudonocardia autotrophica]GEC25258.1 acyl-CoA dehydrogenase [Pseudonocardia saturnea]